ncbi:hypothetical protein PV721_38395 [Streptomyces sp. MB09-01]|uniref:hypothetical protein n=1 Tax=Streptomyces sp. MB09-01 TaxID=3028666 RepID=UPI0029B53A20|nr:hypothetical protein [Streptomyces sp. MB09-01]MDX3540077.1 hypothetical protein [Streptomyces sp. MB09-01]
MKSTTMPWFETLTDSVAALGTAAQEARAAHHAAQAAGTQFKFDRLRHVVGAIADPCQPSAVTDRPHDRALLAIVASHLAHESRMAELYDDAAAAYAFGAAWALLRVLNGQQPPLVELSRQADGRTAIPDELFPVPPAFKGLDTWDGRQQFEQAREELDRVGDLWAYVRGLDQPDVPDTFDLGDVNEKLAAAPNAAFAYGQLAESALAFALLDRRRPHRR